LEVDSSLSSVALLAVERTSSYPSNLTHLTGKLRITHYDLENQDWLHT